LSLRQELFIIIAIFFIFGYLILNLSMAKIELKQINIVYKLIFSIISFACFSQKTRALKASSLLGSGGDVVMMWSWHDHIITIS